MKKYIIVYYSRTGASKKAAERLYYLLGGAEGGKADIEELIDLKERGGPLGCLASVKDALADNITKIEPLKKPPSGYLEVIIVTPVWAGKMSDAVRTYLAAYKSDIRALSIVTCAASSSGEAVQKDILRRFALKARTLVSLKRKEVLSGNIDACLELIFDETNEEGVDKNKSE